MKNVSVVIPVYNGVNYLGKAIESVLAQDYPNIELIVCDGESTDETAKVAESYGAKVVPGKLYSRPNWNVAMQHPTGDYVKMLCHDDTLREDCIRKQVEVLDKNPDVIIASCQRQYIDKNGKALDTPQPIPNSVKMEGKDAALLMLKYGNIIGETSCTLFRNRKLAFPDNLNWLLDMYLWMKLFTEGGLYYIAERMANIRQHDEQDTHRCLRDPDYGRKEASDKNQLLEIYKGAYAA
jgi:glycosyltransferase involved in cell wall biosynthesis